LKLVSNIYQRKIDKPPLTRRRDVAIHYIDRSNDEEIIDIVRSVLDNGTGKAETSYEHILIKLMQIRGTPITSFEFDQSRVDYCYQVWKENK